MAPSGTEPRTPARTFGEEAWKQERVRCSLLVDWPLYPRLAHTMRASNDAQRGRMRGRDAPPTGFCAWPCDDAAARLERFCCASRPDARARVVVARNSITARFASPAQRLPPLGCCEIPLWRFSSPFCGVGKLRFGVTRASRTPPSVNSTPPADNAPRMAASVFRCACASPFSSLQIVRRWTRLRLPAPSTSTPAWRARHAIETR